MKKLILIFLIFLAGCNQFSSKDIHHQLESYYSKKIKAIWSPVGELSKGYFILKMEDGSHVFIINDIWGTHVYPMKKTFGENIK